jgi:hypothetical protein
VLKDLIIDLAKKKFVNIIKASFEPFNPTTLTLTSRPAHKECEDRQTLVVPSIETEVLAIEDKISARHIVSLVLVPLP